MASSVFFNGILHYTPGTFSQVNDEDMSPRNPAVGNDMVIVGRADGGQPNVPIRVQSPEDAKRKVRGGELLVAARKAFGPSSATGGPRTLTLIRVGQATRSSLTLKDGSAADSIVLRSKLYGIPANTIRAKVEAGTLRGKKITVQAGNEYSVGDNLARNAFSVHYTGADAVANITVAGANVVLKSGADAGTAAVRATIAFEDFPTIQEVCDRINAVAGFSATPASGSELLRAASALDFVTAQDVKTASFTVKGDLQAVVDWLNSPASGLAIGERATGAGSPPANVAWTFLTGAADPAVTNEDWSTAIDACERLDIQHIVPLSADSAVHAMVDAHCIFMSDAGQRERRARVGGPAGTDMEEAKSLAAAIGSDRTSFCWPAHYDFDNRGNRVVLPGYMTAVLLAAMAAGVNPGTSLTNKPVRVGGLEFEARNPVDTDELIRFGICVVENAGEDGFKVVRDISTWLSDDNYNRVENSCGSAVDYVARSVRKALDVLRGQKASPSLMSRGLSITRTVLDYLAKEEPAGPGILVGDTKSPAYKNLAASINGDVTGITFQCSPVIPNNFTTVGISVTPYSGTATLT